MEDKIRAINKLDERIKKLKEFLWICENGTGPSQYKDDKKIPQINQFREFTIESAMWTGSQNPRYSKHITNSDDIDLLVNCFKENLKMLIATLEVQLNQMLK